ncbi:hypothetical protein D3C80_1508170 [compost metagenome]
MPVGAMPGEGDAVTQPCLLRQRHDCQALLITCPLRHELGPQNGRTLHHATLHDGIYGKEICLGIRIHPVLGAAIEDDDIRALYGAGKQQSQPEIVKACLYRQLAQQRHYGAFIAGLLEPGDKV